jgi:SAM-dependent methyltransferase
MPDQTGTSPEAGGGRGPTSHERLTGRPWDDSYRDGPAPWDIGRPQAAVARLVDEGAFVGPVLDAGCGTGENALRVAAAGVQVLGVDVAQTALTIAREKGSARGLDAEFVLADAFGLARLDRRFQTVLDCGLFHTFDADERTEYVESLASVTAAGGTLLLLCFSDAEPGDWGPRRITRDELEAAFNPSRGWRVSSVTPDRIETIFDADGASAWLARLERL